jgi:putative membrane protein
MGFAVQAAQMQQTGKQEESQSTSTSNLSASDRRFLMKAASGGMMEVELGRLATEKGSTQNVKDAGQRMVDDHTKSNDRLKQIAEQKGVSLPSDMNAKDRATVERMSKLSGEQFDHAYMQHMTRDHKSDLAEFQKESQSGSDPDIKAFATETIPTMNEHLQMVENQGRSGHEGMTGSTAGATDKGASTSDQADKDKDKDKDTDRDQPPEK